jgi:hypothetical protein
MLPTRVSGYGPHGTGLPDGSFSNQKSKFGKILEGLAMEDAGMFYGHLVYFTAFCHILLTFGIVCGNLVYVFPFWCYVPRKIWQPSPWKSTMSNLSRRK